MKPNESTKGKGEVENETPDTEMNETEATGNQAGVSIPEQFQKNVHNVMQQATTKHHIEHVRNSVNEREEELAAEQKKGSKVKTNSSPYQPLKFSTEDGPTDLSEP